jgi:hypothetical protein
MKQTWTEKNNWKEENILDLVLIRGSSSNQWECYNKKYDCRCTGSIYNECGFFSREFCKPFSVEEQVGLSEKVWYYNFEK